MVIFILALYHSVPWIVRAFHSVPTRMAQEFDHRQGIHVMPALESCKANVGRVAKDMGYTRRLNFRVDSREDIARIFETLPSFVTVE